MIVYVEPNQNIFDICLQEYGHLENLVSLHEANGYDIIPADISAGDGIKIPDLPKNEAKVAILQKKKPATHSQEKIDEITQGGIGYMGIGIDFKVS